MTMKTPGLLLVLLMVSGITMGLVLSLKGDAKSPSLQIGTPVEAATTATGGASSAEYTKLSKAIIALYRRIAVLEKTNDDQQDNVTQVKSDNDSLKKEISGLKQELNAQQSSITTLSQRLSYLDGRGTIK